jgi:UDP-N-acetylglucosamine 3-dehydrogenase
MGVMGQNHARVLAELSEFELIGVFDPLTKTPPAVYKDLFVSDLKSLLKLQPEYCVIASPTSHHFNLAKMMIDSAVNILVEKPITLRIEESSKLQLFLKNSNVKAAVGHIERFNPALITLKEKLNDQILGQVFSVSTFREGPYPNRVQDVGVIKDLAIHDFDILHWLFESEYRWLKSATTEIPGHIFEDHIVAVGQLENGVSVSHSVNWISPVKRRTIIVLGQKGSLVADLLMGDLTFFENGILKSEWDSLNQLRGPMAGSSHKFEINKVEPLKAEHKAFYKYLMNQGRTQLATLADGHYALHVADSLLLHGELKNLSAVE